MTYYEILEVSQTASEEVIRMAYKALAKKYHPDVFQGAPNEAEEKMKQINTAFEVLSDEQKRQQYDDFLKGNHTISHDEQTQTNTASKKQKKSIYPSPQKSAWIIGILLVFNYIQVWHPYAESEWYDYSGLLGLIDFCVLSLLTMLVPLFVGILKSDLSPKGINQLCLINSISLFAISLVLLVTEITSTAFIGWIAAVSYFFINKHILLHIKQHSKSKKKNVITVFIVTVLLISIIFGGMSIFKNIATPIPSQSKNQYTDIAGQVYDLEGYDKCVIVRTVTFSDEYTANSILAKIENKKSNEQEAIAIMNQYGAEQGGGKGHLIHPGDLVEEVDTWCFDGRRKVGDIAIIENAYGYSICYISAIFPE